jgi:hypothetical protein
MTVWIYINTAKEVGDDDHLKVFASEEAAERWFVENDPEGAKSEMGLESDALATLVPPAPSRSNLALTHSPKPRPSRPGRRRTREVCA